MAEIKDGGAAFACCESGHCMGQKGMTLRDWFAGQAMSGMFNAFDGYGLAAEEAYKYADALISERERRERGK